MNSLGDDSVGCDDRTVSAVGKHGDETVGDLLADGQSSDEWVEDGDGRRRGSDGTEDFSGEAVLAMVTEPGRRERRAFEDQKGAADGGSPGIGVSEGDGGIGRVGGRDGRGERSEGADDGSGVDAGEAALESKDVGGDVEVEAGFGAIAEHEGPVVPECSVGRGHRGNPIGGKNAEDAADGYLGAGVGVDGSGQATEVLATAIVARDETAELARRGRNEVAGEFHASKVPGKNLLSNGYFC